MTSALMKSFHAMIHSNSPSNDKLNSAQQQAVDTTEGPLLVLAGAGTGKTRVLTHRIAHIITSGRAQPYQILAVTFTNKAALEMKQRVRAVMEAQCDEGGYPIPTDGMWLGTFHALCTRILRQHIEHLGYSDQFTILDTDDQLRLLKQLILAADLDISRYPPKMVSIVISRWKDKGLFPDQVRPFDRKADSVIVALYKDYQERLQTLNALDFGDLLILTLKLFQEYPAVLKSYHNQFKYILVDEYQDTNVAQYLWLRLLAQGTDNICCVGDDDQSIYGWRGAEVGNILRFERDFPGANIIKLEDNYRSTSHILGAASTLIAHNRGRLGKELKSVKEDGEKITIKACWNCEDEARYVGDEVERHQRSGTALKHMAVLVRAGYQTRQFEERFMTMGIPYRVIGGMRFYERAEIRDALAYLRLVYQPSDALAFERIVNVPKRGIGQTSLNICHTIARDEGIPLPKATYMACQTSLLKGQARSSLLLFFQQLEHWRAQISTLKPSELAGLILDESGYMTMWRNDQGGDAPQRIENLKELVHAMDDFETLQGFLEHVSLVLDTTSSSEDDMINVMTLHGAKGLEFDVVFLPAWEDGVFPHPKSIEEGNLEEERRLAYVGLTRAKKKAVITYANFRRMGPGQYGGGGRPGYPSQFLHEIPPHHTIRIHSNGIVDEGKGAVWTSHKRRDTGRDHFAQEDYGFQDDAFSQDSDTYKRPKYRDRSADIERRVLPPRQRAVTYQKQTRPPANSISTAPVVSHHAFKVGDRVMHPTFLQGTIQSVEGDKLVIQFDDVGVKNIIANFVKKM